jgi:site-specific DNA recombinase
VTERWALVLAAAAVVGAHHPHHLPVMGLVALVVVAWRRHWLPVACLAMALLTGGLTQRSLDGLEGAVVTDVIGEVVLISDPKPAASGVRAEARAGTRRLELRARGTAAEALAPRLAGEVLAIRGEVRPTPRSGWLVSRHIGARLTVLQVDDWRPGDLSSRVANGLRRTIQSGAGSLDVRQRSLFTGLVYGDVRDQPWPSPTPSSALGSPTWRPCRGRLFVILVSMTARRALIYTRVSQDRADGRSPAEQEAEARSQCDREGWDVVEVVTDSVGASRHSKGKRGGWNRALDLITSGNVDMLVTWEASRAQRDLTAYATLRDLCVKHEVEWSYSGRTHDLSSSRGRFDTGLDALLAEREADETSERVRRAMRANATKGRPHGRRLFGYTRVYDTETGRLDGQEPHSSEAAVVRRIFDDYLSGQGIRTVARALNDDGITTGTGARWTDIQVRRVLANAAYAARRVHRGEVVGDADWPALVTDNVFDRVQHRLDARRGVRQTGTARLLTGVARCGVCGGKMHVLRDRNRRRTYGCRDSYCVARDMEKLDAYVTVVVLERLARPDVGDLLADAPDPAVARAREDAAALQGRLDDAIREFTAGNITAATLAKIEVDLGARIAAAERTARAALVPIDLDMPEASGVEAWWDNLDPQQCREIVAALIAAVVVLPTRQGERTFNPETVRIDWR